MKNTSLARFASLVLIFALIVPSTSSAFIEGVSAGSAALGAPAPVGSVAPGLASSAAGSSVSSLQCAACQMNPELPLFCPEVTCFDPLGVVGLCAAQGFCLGLSYVVGAGVLAMGLSGGGLSGSSASDSNNAVAQTFGGAQCTGGISCSLVSSGSTGSTYNSASLFDTSTSISTPQALIDSNKAVTDLQAALKG